MPDDDQKRKVTAAGIVEGLPGPDGQRFAEVLRRGDVQVELYAPRGEDRQTPHSRDELYFIVRGEGVFINGAEYDEFGPGDMLFVPAGVHHCFEKFTDDLAAWVVFFGPEGGTAAG